MSSAGKGQDERVLCTPLHLERAAYLGESDFSQQGFPLINLEFRYLKKLLLEPELHDLRKKKKSSKSSSELRGKNFYKHA